MKAQIILTIGFNGKETHTNDFPSKVIEKVKKEVEAVQWGLQQNADTLGLKMKFSVDVKRKL